MGNRLDQKTLQKDGVIANNMEEMMSLFCLIEKKKWDSVLERLQTEHGKKEASHPDYKGYPIHLACTRRNVPLKAITALLEAYPDGIQQQTDDYGQLPIHCSAWWNNTSLDVMDLLIQKYPMGVRTPNNNGWLPLHYAASNNKSKDVIYLLIKSYPEGVQKTNIDGTLPIHRAAMYNPSIDVIQLLFDHYPESVKQSNPKNNDMFLINLFLYNTVWNSTAVNVEKSINILQQFINSYPESIILTAFCTHLVVKSQFLRPLELATARNLPSMVIKFLIEEEEMFIISLARVNVERQNKNKSDD